MITKQQAKSYLVNPYFTPSMMPMEVLKMWAVKTAMDEYNGNRKQVEKHLKVSERTIRSYVRTLKSLGFEWRLRKNGYC